MNKVQKALQAAERVGEACVVRAPDTERFQVRTTPTSHASLWALARALEALKHGG